MVSTSVGKKKQTGRHKNTRNAATHCDITVTHFWDGNALAHTLHSMAAAWIWLDIIYTGR